MERFIRFTAPIGKIDFVFKLFVFLLICGGLNHLRHVLTHGLPANKSFWTNFTEASFTALPMCAFALLLIGHLNTLQKRLYLQATRDSLTRLPNRRWFMDNTPKTLAPNLSVMIIDIDYFKKINDRFGHDAGDLCLQQMGEHLKRCVGPSNSVARIGGEEFAVFLPEMDTATLEKTAKSISAGFRFDVDATTSSQITASVGIATTKGQVSRTDALRLADIAVYRAKSNGRACFVHLEGDAQSIPAQSDAIPVAEPL